jgi:hypothetical protein
VQEEYVGGLTTNIANNVYEFKEGMGTVPLMLRQLALTNQQSATGVTVVVGTL